MEGSLCQEVQCKEGKELGSKDMMALGRFGAWGGCHWSARGVPLLVRKSKQETGLEEIEVKEVWVWNLIPRGNGSQEPNSITVCSQG